MIWIDITDLSNWSGHMTGIQRVVYNIALRYERDSPGQIGYFKYDAGQREFFTSIIDFDSWENKLHPSSPMPSLKGRIVSLVPAAVRHRTPQIAKRVLKKSLSRSQSTKKEPT